MLTSKIKEFGFLSFGTMRHSTLLRVPENFQVASFKWTFLYWEAVEADVPHRLREFQAASEAQI